MSELIRPPLVVPDGPQILDLQPGRIVRGRGLGRLLREAARREAEGLDPLMAGAASYSDYAEQKILEHSVGKAEWTKPTVFLALCTAAPTDSSTGATISEAGYTGYARLEVKGEKWTYSAPAIKNNATLTFAECTASESTIKGWALCDSGTKGAGNVIAWGTVTEVKISTTQTPATVNSEALVVELD
jgi:hypothetical protein